jgi:hypothetical protein
MRFKHKKIPLFCGVQYTKSAELIIVSDPLIARIPILGTARSGWHLPTRFGVAVASQVLCTSTTLNKRITILSI